MTDPTTSGGPAGLASRVQQIHVPEPNADRETRLLRGGIAVVIFGLFLIVLSYYQVSGTSSVPEQLSFLASGAIPGLAFVILGSTLIMRFSLARLFRYWLARTIYEHQVQTDRTVEALGRIEAALAGGVVPSAPAPEDRSPGIGQEPLRAEPLDG